MEDPADSETPHILACVANRQPFEDGAIAVSEATTILFLAANYGLSDEHWRYTKIPVCIQVVILYAELILFPSLRSPSSRAPVSRCML